ncbi:uncharacterized protein LOC131889935 [Tigriopus californicus]|uniref:uncharacterized protein LOC131889935 n=1 Tax=Tigriopus californicus TaxID=6832 RepID=UPI0027D9D3A4|nr:uncharacterized protein LOC131889935 [Tigriopus californicus]
MNLKLLFLLGTAFAHDMSHIKAPDGDVEEFVPESIRNARTPKILEANGRVKPIEENDETVELDPQSEIQGNRDPKQFWPLPHFYPRGQFGVPSVLSSRINIPPMAYQFQPLENAQSESNEDLTARVAETTQNRPFSFADDATAEEERVIVESVNELIGAVGRQAIGSHIYAESDGPGGQNSGLPNLRPLDDDVILPGRPNLEPVESVTSDDPFESFVRPQECCLFVFFDGSAYYFDDYLRMLTGHYRLMYGTVNGHPHYVARGCKEAELYGPNCSYIWHSNYGWIIGIGTYIGQTKGVAYTRTQSQCPTSSDSGWRYLNKDLDWKENGNIVLECAS